MNEKTKILLLEEKNEARESLWSRLLLEKDFDIFQSTLSGSEAVRCARSLNPEIMIIDSNSCDIENIQLKTNVQKIITFPQTSNHILIISRFKSQLIPYSTKQNFQNLLVHAIKNQP